jgi:hypothetical protein
MNSPDPFEERLRRTPFREAPASLRRDVLSSAECTTDWARSPIRAWLASWTWPHRMAWASLGLAWVIILVLNLAALETGENRSEEKVPPRVSPALTAAVREQRALLDRLLQEPTAAAQPSRPGPDAGLWRDRRGGGALV